jgi:urea carboxylase
LGTVKGPGLRTYLAVAGGFDAPLYLGARATFSLGGFGGHSTGVLKAGDTLRLKSSETSPAVTPLPVELPVLASQWDIEVIYGPHGAPDFFTPGDIETLFNTDYEVHFNSARTGVRLIGPKPQWARPDGGEAGLHPSNLHDNAYAIGAIDFTGDMPIILGPDGPSLGGFVCPAVIAEDELWKMGQFKPGDKVRFRLRAGPELLRSAPQSDRLKDGPDGVVHRRQGDGNLLVEFGEPTLDLASRIKAHLLMQAVEREAPAGVIDLTPGIRSLQLHFDPAVLPPAKLLDLLNDMERGLPDPRSVNVPSREVWLPLSWNDEQAELAMRKYQELVRPDAPWCPSNIEFIRRINGLASEDAVRGIVFDASYLVMGLGDVYLGAPVATPLDPRHRLVTTKYNPARTWTPENAVGIGGAYLCVYGMEGPGGYQLFGRTIQMWNRWKKTEVFEQPWLLRFFDRIRFFPVSNAELAEARAAFPHGEYRIRIEDGEFSLAAQDRFLASQAAGITAFKARQQAAFDAERRRWREQGLDSFVSEEKAAPPDDEVPPGQSPVHCVTMGTVWKLDINPGEKVREGQTILVIETMKMETPILAPASGVLTEWRCQPGAVVKAGQVVALIKEDG